MPSSHVGSFSFSLGKKIIHDCQLWVTNFRLSFGTTLFVSMLSGACAWCSMVLVYWTSNEFHRSVVFYSAVAAASTMTNTTSIFITYDLRCVCVLVYTCATSTVKRLGQQYWKLVQLYEPQHQQRFDITLGFGNSVLIGRKFQHAGNSINSWEWY